MKSYSVIPIEETPVLQVHTRSLYCRYKGAKIFKKKIVIFWSQLHGESPTYFLHLILEFKKFLRGKVLL